MAIHHTTPVISLFKHCQTESLSSAWHKHYSMSKKKSDGAFPHMKEMDNLKQNQLVFYPGLGF